MRGNYGYPQPAIDVAETFSAIAAALARSEVTAVLAGPRTSSATGVDVAETPL
jgi:hypothetical protein